jgi:hypothetical protein
MKFLLLLFSLVVSIEAQAQFSVQEADGDSRFRLFGNTFSPSFYSLTSIETDKFNDEGGRLSMYNYLTLKTWAGNGFRPLIRIPFQYNSAGTDRFDGAKQMKQDVFLQDIILGVMKSDLVYLPWDIGVWWEGRAYLPTSKNSANSGLITRLRNNFILSKVLSKYFEVEYDQKFSYFFQSRSANEITFRDEFDFEQTATSLTKKMEYDQRLNFWYKITARTGLGWEIGTKDQYYNKSAANNNKYKPAIREVRMGPSIRVPLNDSVNFILVYEDNVELANSQQLGKFYADNTQFLLHSFISF